MRAELAATAIGKSGLDPEFLWSLRLFVSLSDGFVDNTTGCKFTSRTSIYENFQTPTPVTQPNTYFSSDVNGVLYGWRRHRYQHAPSLFRF